MKTSTKTTIAIGVATIATVTATVIASEKIAEKMHHCINRKKARYFVQKKFNGNEKLMNVVDNLSDKDLDSVMKVAKKVKEGQVKVAGTKKEFKANAEELKAKVNDFVEEKFN